MAHDGSLDARLERRFVAAMFLVGAAVYVQTFDVQAILPVIAADLGITGVESALTLSATTLGMAVGVLPWAYASDRAGRLRIIRSCIVAATIVSLVAPLVPGLAPLLVARVAKGVLLAGVTGLAVATVFERVPASRAVIASGVSVSGSIVGGVVTRVVSGLVESVSDWRIALLAVAGIGAGLTVAVLVLLRGVHDLPRASASLDPGVPRPSLAAQLARSRVALCFAQGFIALGVFNALFSVLPFRLADAFADLGAVGSSAILGLFAVAFASAQVGGRLAARFGRMLPLGLGYALAIAGFGVLELLPGAGWLAVGVAAAVLGIFLVNPLNNAESGRRMPTHRAQSTAMYQISWLAGATIVNPLATAIYGHAGWSASIGLLLALVACGVVLAIADRSSPVAT